MDFDYSDPQFKDNVQLVVKDYLNTEAFADRKITDTPTDDLQVTNKKYVTSYTSIFASSSFVSIPVTESKISLSDVTTLNATASVHGFLPKLSSVSGTFLNGNGQFASIVGVTFDGISDDTISVGNAISMGWGNSSILQVSSTAGTSNDVINSTTWISQSFKTSADARRITRTALYMSGNGGTATGNLECRIYADSGGAPTGAYIGRAVAGYNGLVNQPTQTEVQVDFLPYNPAPVSSLTTYHAVFFDYHNFTEVVAYRNSIAGVGTNLSTNSGSSWSANNGPLNFKVYESHTQSGKLYRSTSANPDDLLTNYVGFALNSASIAGSITGQIGGVASNLSGLTGGGTYYLSDTKGQISSVVGSNTKVAGIGMSSGQLLIKNNT